ncbi:hypothetical protein [Urbifossiella limnaea]|nr:hypothetical protein [Urbifossiella limnaea]
MWLDTRAFRQWGWLAAPGSRSGSLGWGAVRAGRHEAEIQYDLTVGESAGSVGLRYALAGDPKAVIDYRVSLVTTACHLGGRRWWFQCPLVRGGTPCRRRVRKLFLVGRYFGCRGCHDLTYRSRQQSDSRVYAAVRTGVGLGHASLLDRLSVEQLGFMLKVATLREKQRGRSTHS